MKLAIINLDDLYTNIHGVATFHRNFRNFVKYNDDIQLFYYSGSKKGKPEIKQLNSTFTSIPIPWSIEFYEHMFFSFHPLSFYHWIKYFKNEFKAKNIELVQISSQDPLCYAAVQAAKSLNIPVIGSYHTRVAEYGSNWLHHWLAKIKFPIKKPFTSLAFFILSRWSRNIYNSCDLILATNQHMVKHLSRLGYHKQKMQIVGRGVDSIRFQPGEKQKGKTTLLYVGRLSAEKDLHELEFVNNLKNIELRMVGNGKLLKKLQQVIPKAKFTGWITGELLTNEYAQADLFVFPSKTDTFSNAVLEAMSSGLPIIGYNNQGLNDRVQHRVNGYLANSEEEFKKYTKDLIKNKEKRKRCSIKARECAKDLSWEKIFTSYLDILSHALNNKNSKNEKTELKEGSFNQIKLKIKKMVMKN